MNGYNLIAPYYLFFVKLVFGDLLFKAQTHFLTKDLDNQQILIVGGGRGELLSFCLSQYPTTRITYVESSSKMIELSEKRVSIQDQTRVDFQCKSIFEWDTSLTFDLVLLPFVLDLFSEINCLALLRKTKAILHEEGSLIVTDFSKNPAKFQKALVGLMYLLFNSVGATERSKLPEFYALFAAEQLSIFKEKKLGLGPYQDLVLTFQLTLC
jgi:ubiquinone/menaquinone biosynthesis C-methylase UbiE